MDGTCTKIAPDDAVVPEQVLTIRVGDGVQIDVHEVPGQWSISVFI